MVQVLLNSGYGADKISRTEGNDESLEFLCLLIFTLCWRFKYERKNFSKLSALYWKEEAILFSKKARYS